MKKSCLVCGFGSIGQRHSLNLNKLGYSVTVWQNKKTKKYKNFKYYKFTNNLKESIQDASFVIIATPTHTHFKIINKCLDLNKNIYIEKPISNNIKHVEIIKKQKNFKKVTIQVGCQLRSDPQILKIKNIIQQNLIGKILTYRGDVGENLYLWRKKNPLKSYSSITKKGGGVYLDLIHDIDLIFYILGEIYIKNSFSKKIGNVTIDARDYCMLKFTSKNNCIGILTMDMLNPIHKREIEIIGQKGSLYWNESKRTIVLNNISNKKIVKEKILKDKFKRNDIFVLHLKNFLDSIHKKDKLVCDFKSAVNSMKLITDIKLL